MIDIKVKVVLRVVLVGFLLSSQKAMAQDEEPLDVAPPPAKLLLAEDKKQIDTEKNIKRQVEISLKLLEEKLKSAEDLANQQNYRATLDQLGTYQALIEYMLKLFEKYDKQDGRFFNAIKDFEIALRKQTPRLELIRREIPYRYGWYVQKLIRFVREARSKTIEPMLLDATG